MKTALLVIFVVVANVNADAGYNRSSVVDDLAPFKEAIEFLDRGYGFEALDRWHRDRKATGHLTIADEEMFSAWTQLAQAVAASRGKIWVDGKDGAECLDCKTENPKQWLFNLRQFCIGEVKYRSGMMPAIPADVCRFAKNK